METDTLPRNDAPGDDLLEAIECELARSEWRTALIVSAIVIVLSVIAADSLGSRNGPERPRIEIQSK